MEHRAWGDTAGSGQSEDCGFRIADLKKQKTEILLWERLLGVSLRERLDRRYFPIDRHELYGKVAVEWSSLHSVPLAPTSHPRSVWWGHSFLH